MDLNRLGTAALDDDAFVELFESCRLPAAQFHHADHIRLAWIYLGRMSEQEAAARIEQSIRRFAAHNGVSEKYHHTITLAWMRLVAAARCASYEAVTFAEFSCEHPELFEVNALSHYYSGARLASDEAKLGWMEPDRSELPQKTKRVE
jgi:hypothetical protein